MMGRKSRKDNLEVKVIPTWTQALKAIKSGRTEEAIKFLEQARSESEKNNDNMTSFIEMVVTHLATFGEEELEKVFRQRYDPVVRNWLATKPTVEKSLQKWINIQNEHLGHPTVIEEPDRYVVTCDPCGTGGRLRRARPVGTTQKAHPWSWGKTGVPYYCCHCAVHWEIIPIELQGYPAKITLLSDRPEGPCVQLFYKKAELISEEYFLRVGKTKSIK